MLTEPGVTVHPVRVLGLVVRPGRVPHVVGVRTDKGEVLSAGARGALFSLPELAFFNIRKGSLPFAPRPRAP